MLRYFEKAKKKKSMNKVLLYLTKGKKSLKEDQMQVMDSSLAVREQ